MIIIKKVKKEKNDWNIATQIRSLKKNVSPAEILKCYKANNDDK